MIKILGILIKTSFLHSLQYRAQFISAFIASGLEIILYVLFIQSIFGNVTSIKGWSMQEILLLFGLSTISISIVRLFITPNLSYMTGLIRKGELDFVLTKPVDSQFMVSFATYNFFSITQFIQGIIIIAFSGVTITLTNALLCLLYLIIGSAIFYSVWFTILLIVFKAIVIDNAIVAVDTSLSITRYPISIYPKYIRIVFTYVLPLAFVSYIPAGFLLGKMEWKDFVLAVILGGIFIFLSRVAWLFAIKHYSSASS
ncbi:ABC transporter permease [Paenibacillus woosongensis]|nr:ABC-2 family transporter protein [Paenibacillus woosongensis]